MDKITRQVRIEHWTQIMKRITWGQVLESRDKSSVKRV